MNRIKKKFQDWMTIITFAEAGEPDMGLRIVGEKESRKIQVAERTVDFRESAPLRSEAETQPAASAVAPEPAVEKSPQKGKLEVLVVDDEPIVGKRLKPALSKYGYDVEIYDNPVAAMERFDQKEFDIVVTDLRMDDLDGIGVLEHVVSKSDKTKVIFITGYATVENAREALVKGAFDFIAKPFKINDLRMAITKAALSLGYLGGVAGAPA